MTLLDAAINVLAEHLSSEHKQRFRQGSCSCSLCALARAVDAETAPCGRCGRPKTNHHVKHRWVPDVRTT